MHDCCDVVRRLLAGFHDVTQQTHKITDEREKEEKNDEEERRRFCTEYGTPFYSLHASSALVVALKPFNRDIARHTPNSDY